MRIVNKLWGREEWIHNDRDYCMKLLVLKKGSTSSLHTHKRKRETFLIVKGKVELEYDGRIMLLEVGQSLNIEPGIYHRFRSLTRTAWVVEASTFHSDEDVYRKEESKKDG